MIQASLPQATLESYAHLKREARDVADVGKWFTENTDALGPLPPHSPGQIAVEAKFSIAAITMILVGKAPEDALKVRVSVNIKNEELEPSPFAELTGLAVLQPSIDAVYTSIFPMHFDEWSLPIAEVAFEYVATNGYNGNYKPECGRTSKRLLDTHLGQHFPGLSVSWLDSMLDMDLFERNPDDESKDNMNGYNKKAFFDTLFKSRQPSPTFVVPAEFTL